MKLLASLFSCVHSRVKLFVFAMNSRRRYSIFSLRIKRKELKMRSCLRRLPSAVNVMLSLSIVISLTAKDNIILYCQINVPYSGERCARVTAAQSLPE